MARFRATVSGSKPDTTTNFTGQLLGVPRFTEPQTFVMGEEDTKEFIDSFIADKGIGFSVYIERV